MGVSAKTPKVSSVVAAICIVIYTAAIAFGAVQIILNMKERQDIAESEFYDLADRATSSSVFLGFMSEAYQATIRDFLGASETLLGVIITGSNSEYSFERYPGSGIIWAGNSPRFKTGAGYSAEPLFLPLGIDGQRNVTIQAIYGTVDYGLFQRTLKNTLLVVLSSLIVAFMFLISEITSKKKAVYKRNEPEASLDEKSSFDYRPTPAAPINEETWDEDEENPKGLYKPRGNIGWDSYINDRLSSELHRCAAFEQDLVLLAMELKCKGKTSDSLYCQFTEEAVNFFTMRDLIFGKGENGITVIMPNINLEQGIAKSEEFHTRLTFRLPEMFRSSSKTPGNELCIGLTSRSGRLIDADRLILEANSALDKAIEDPLSHVVAFKSDPEKYREFVKGAY